MRTVTPWGYVQHAHLKSKPVWAAMWDMEQFTRRICREEKVGFFDIRGMWDDYMHRSDVRYDFISRNSIHANSRGKQLPAKILTRFFEPQDDE